MNNRLINTKVAGGGGCTDIVDNYDPFGGNGVALYQLNGDATDVSGNYNGTASNVTYGLGVFGQAGVFNGTNSNISLPLSSWLTSTSAKSCSVWFNTSFSGAGNRAIISDYQGGGGTYNFDCFLTPTDGKIIVVTKRGTQYEGTSINSFNDGQWHLAVIVDDIPNGNLKFYVDNNLEVTIPTDSGSITSSVLYVGTYGAGYYWDGSIDQVRIFNTALTPLEVEALYTEELCICDGTVDTLDILGDGSCIATYQLDGNANDLSGNYSGTPTNVSYGVGEFDLAGVFNGSSSLISNTVGATPITSFSMWVKFNSTSQNSYLQVFDNNDYAIFLYNGKLNIQYSSGSTSNGVAWTITNTTDWFHIAGTFTSSSSTLYVNKVQKTESMSNWINAGSVPYIGNRNDLTGYFNGSIDQVRIFNKALSAGEVTTLYNETACSIPNPIENASFHYDPTTLSDGAVTSWSDGGSINRSLDLVSGTTTISKVTSGGIEYVDFSYSASDTNVSYLRTGGSTLTTYPDYPTNTSFTWVQFANINTAYNNNVSYPYLASIFNTLESENGAFTPHIWRSGLSFSYRLGLIMNNGSRFYDIALATSNSDIRPYGTWKMIGLTFEYNQASTSYVKIYIDGALVETWSNTGTWGVLNNTLMLGARQFSGGQRGGYQIGDTLGFVGEAKTDSEIAEIYRLLKGKYGL